jgi:hypothetical protein
MALLSKFEEEINFDSVTKVINNLLFTPLALVLNLADWFSLDWVNKFMAFLIAVAVLAKHVIDLIRKIKNKSK